MIAASPKLFNLSIYYLLKLRNDPFAFIDVFQLTIEVDEGEEEELLELLKTKFAKAEVLHQAQTRCKTQKPVNREIINIFLMQIISKAEHLFTW